MTRSDVHRDGLARELGATQYESARGKTTAAGDAEGHPQQHARARGAEHRGPWPRRVGDVMTRSVVTIDRRTPYKRIASMLAEHRISAVPVLVLGRHVAGVVSEADLLSAQERRLHEAQIEPGGRFRRHAGATTHWGLTAAELMTSPAVTIHPDAPLPAASRLMSSKHLKRLPVVEAGTAFGGGVGGKLIGIVSRCDLLSVCLRPDEDIAGDVREMLAELPQAHPGGGIAVTVHNGVVTLTGLVGPAEEHDLIRVAGRLTWGIDGVLDVVNHLGATEPVTAAAPGQHDAQLKPEEFLAILTKPEELVGMLAKPGEFIASAYDFAERMLTSQRKFAEGMVEATMPVLGGADSAAANEDDDAS